MSIKLSKNDDGIITLQIDPIISIINNSNYFISYHPSNGLPDNLLGFAFPNKSGIPELKMGYTTYYSAKDSLKSLFFDFMKKDQPLIQLSILDNQTQILNLSI